MNNTGYTLSIHFFNFTQNILLYPTLFIGKWIPFFILPGIGRFYPLDGFEYNILSIFSVSPTLFYLYNATQFIILVFLLFQIIYKFVGIKDKRVIFLIILAIVFTPGFITAWLRLFVPERNVLFFMTLFLYTYLKFNSEQKAIWMVAGFLFANIALYYKEPVFLMIGSLAFLNMIMDWKNGTSKQKIFNLSLLFSVIVFLLAYYFLVYVHIGTALYGQTTLNTLMLLAKNLFNYSLNDPLIVFVFLPFLLIRIWVLTTKKGSLHPIYDPMLVGALLYFVVFIKLNMFAEHYLLPIYLFAFVPLAFFINKVPFKKIKLVKILLIIGIIFYILSAFPRGLHLIAFYKSVPENYQKTIDFLVSYISSTEQKGKRISIFIDGVNRCSGVEVYHSLIKYLEFRGLSPMQFDVKTDEEDDGILVSVGKIDEKSPYTVCNQKSPSLVKSGDLVILSPYTKRYISYCDDIPHVFLNYEIIHHAHSFITIPDIGIKPLVKYILMDKFSGKNERYMVSKNIFGLPLDFYVLRKR